MMQLHSSTGTFFHFQVQGPLCDKEQAHSGFEYKKNRIKSLLQYKKTNNIIPNNIPIDLKLTTSTISIYLSPHVVK